MRSTGKLRLIANKAVNQVMKENGGVYFNHIPILEICNKLQEYGFDIVNEDGTPFEAIFCGANGSTSINMSYQKAMLEDCSLQLQWHNMNNVKNPKRVEINAYIG